MNFPQQQQLGQFLRKLRGTSVSNLPSGLPARPMNQDGGNADGVYHQDGTTDPGIQHGVTGTGNGPIIGIG